MKAVLKIRETFQKIQMFELNFGKNVSWKGLGLRRHYNCGISPNKFAKSVATFQTSYTLENPRETASTATRIQYELTLR